MELVNILLYVFVVEKIAVYIAQTRTIADKNRNIIFLGGHIHCPPLLGTCSIHYTASLCSGRVGGMEDVYCIVGEGDEG